MHFVVTSCPCIEKIASKSQEKHMTNFLAFIRRGRRPLYSILCLCDFQRQILQTLPTELPPSLSAITENPTHMVPNTCHRLLYDRWMHPFFLVYIISVVTALLVESHQAIKQLLSLNILQSRTDSQKCPPAKTSLGAKGLIKS